MWSDAVVKLEVGSRGYWAVLVRLALAGEGWVEWSRRDWL
jgi:hypothetical protein